MSRAQSFRRCPFGCGVVSLSHRCQQRPQSKMRGPTAGVTTTPAWDAQRWQAHLASKTGPAVKPRTWKYGDRVRMNSGMFAGCTGTIDRKNSLVPELWSVDITGDNSYWVAEKDIELVEPAHG